MSRNLLLLFLSFFILSCTHQNEEALIIESFKKLTEIPSASGIEVVNNEIWMVGDDSPFLFRLDMDLNLINKYSISSVDQIIANRIIKSEKADFESIVYNGEVLLIAGSGSRQISRDTLVKFDLVRQEVSKVNTRLLFEQFKMLAGFDKDMQINIEGIAGSKGYFYFLNRGNVNANNDVFRLPQEEFDQYLLFGDSVKGIEHFRFDLPSIKNYLSGFSGACISEDEEFLYFTSSVEATTDVYNDGEVLGSFIGEINLITNELRIWPLKEKGRFVKTKLESVSITEHKPEFIRFVCTSDNDDGTSGVYRLKLNLKTDSYE